MSTSAYKASRQFGVFVCLTCGEVFGERIPSYETEARFGLAWAWPECLCGEAETDQILLLTALTPASEEDAEWGYYECAACSNHNCDDTTRTIARIGQAGECTCPPNCPGPMVLVESFVAA